jgi:ATP/maltotriose-dependent transcriptional regulator MalT/DNA-binding SARP family transcriptional activator
LVEARAGQGKTVLVSQFEAEGGRPFFWVNCQDRHRDPSVLYAELLGVIGEGLPATRKEELRGLLRQQMPPAEVPEKAAIFLAKELDARPGLTLVFDDAHELKDSLAGLLLKRLVQAAGERIRFILISRFPVMLEGQPLFPRKDCLVIDNDLLAFSREEIAVLYNRHYGVPVEAAMVNTLLEATEGWAAGLSLLREDPADCVRLRNIGDDDSLEAFFARQPRLSALSGEAGQRFAMLGLLPVMPTGLVSHLVEADVVEVLVELADINFFVRSDLRRGERHLAFHNLFQGFLRKRAEAFVSEAQRAGFLKSAAAWHRTRGEDELALQCLAWSKDWAALEDALDACGLGLLADNKVGTVLALVGHVPDDLAHKSGTFLLLAGLARLAGCDGQATILLGKAARVVARDGNDMAELLALCGILNHHLIIGSRLDELPVILERAAMLFRKNAEELPVPAAIQCACAISTMYSYMYGKLDRAREFAAAATALHARSGSAKKCYPAFMANVFADCVAGCMLHILDRFEEFFFARNDVSFSGYDRFQLETLHLNVVEMAGRFEGYRAEKEEMLGRHAGVLESSYIGGFLGVWDMDVLMARGDCSGVLAMAEKLIADPRSESQPHLLSQFLHYKALAMAHCGQMEGLMDIVRKSLRMRARAPKRYFVALNRILLGAALTMTSLSRTGERMLRRGLAVTLEMGEHYNRAGAYFYLAAHCLRQGRAAEALEEARRFLETMRASGNVHFFGLSGGILPEILSAAMRGRLESGLVQKLARTHLDADILSDGNVMPLLFVDDIGGLHLHCDGAELSGDSIGPRSREILALLAARPRHVMPVEEVAQSLWPDSSTEKSRITFDTALSRLRGAIAGAFGQGRGKAYLMTKNGMLALCHCRVASVLAIGHAAEGLDLARQGKPWQACGSFETLRGLFHPEAAGQSLEPFTLHGREKILEAFRVWADLQTRCGNTVKALEIVNFGLALAPANEPFQVLRYNLLTGLKRPREASEGLRRYRSLLEEEGYSEEEISDIVDKIFTA